MKMIPGESLGNFRGFSRFMAVKFDSLRANKALILWGGYIISLESSHCRSWSTGKSVRPFSFLSLTSSLVSLDSYNALYYICLLCLFIFTAVDWVLVLFEAHILRKGVSPIYCLSIQCHYLCFPAVDKSINLTGCRDVTLALAFRISINVFQGCGQAVKQCSLPEKRQDMHNYCSGRPSSGLNDI